MKNVSSLYEIVVSVLYNQMFHLSDFSLDAKFRFDDNAAFRQKELFALRDWSQEDEKEVAAAKVNILKN